VRNAEYCEFHVFICSGRRYRDLVAVISLVALVIG
jgi:hypothetical protein